MGHPYGHAWGWGVVTRSFGKASNLKIKIWERKSIKTLKVGFRHLQFYPRCLAWHLACRRYSTNVHGTNRWKEEPRGEWQGPVESTDEGVSFDWKEKAFFFETRGNKTGRRQPMQTNFETWYIAWSHFEQFRDYQHGRWCHQREMWLGLDGGLRKANPKMSELERTLEGIYPTTLILQIGLRQRNKSA